MWTVDDKVDNNQLTNNGELHGNMSSMILHLKMEAHNVAVTMENAMTICPP